MIQLINVMFYHLYNLLKIMIFVTYSNYIYFEPRIELLKNKTHHQIQFPEDNKHVDVLKMIMDTYYK